MFDPYDTDPNALLNFFDNLVIDVPGEIVEVDFDNNTNENKTMKPKE